MGTSFPFLLCLSLLFLFTAICKASSDSHFAFFHFFFLGMVLLPVSCTMSWTSIHSSSDTLSDLIPWIYLSLPLYNHKGFDLGHTWMVWGFLVAQSLKCLPTMQETQVRSLGPKDLLEEEMVTHSSILTWRIPWTEEPGRLQFMGLQRIRYDWARTHTYLFLGVSLIVQWVKNPPENAGDTGDAGLISGSGRSLRGGHGNPLQYSCLENPMDRIPWTEEPGGL